MCHFVKKRSTAVASAMLALSVLALFAPLGQYDFVDFDDNVYVTDNRRVQSGLTTGNVAWAFTTLDAGFWHPLTWLSLMLDYEFYGLRAGGFHWTNVLLHAAAVALLFLALYRMTGALWKSLLVAALLPSHPLRVEPVAWISERKDVLAAFFWMLTLLAYASYARRPGKLRYGLFLLPFVLGLMAKPTLVTLPFVLLLLDWWPLRRVRGETAMMETRATGPTFAGTSIPGLVAEKLPLLLLVVLAAVLTYVAESRAGALSPLDAFPLMVRIENALVSYAAYLWKTVWPADLAVYYPHPGARPWMLVVLSGLMLAVITLWFGSRWRSRPYGIVGWLWFLGVLVPVIGIVQIGFIAMADRYAYIPQIGLFIIAVWGGADLLDKRTAKKAVSFVLAFCVLATLAFLSRQQMDTWQNTATLFQQALRVTGENSKAHHGMGMAYQRQGKSDLAVAHLTESLRIRKEARAHNDLGVVLMSRERFAEAERQFRESLRLEPGNARYHNNLGSALASQGRLEEAARYFREALRIDPDYVSPRKNLHLMENGK